MNVMIRAARAYYRANVQAWQALRRSRTASFRVLVGLYLAITLGLNAAGHLGAAQIATVALGVPLLAAGWTV